MKSQAKENEAMVFEDNPRRRLIRLSQILKSFMEKENVTTSPVFIKIDDSIVLDKRLFNRVGPSWRPFIYEVSLPP